MNRIRLNQYVAKYETWKEQSRYRNPFDFVGTLFGRISHPIYDDDSLAPAEKDEIMLAYDWQQVGNDFRRVMG